MVKEPQLPPHDIESEMSLLGSMCLDRGIIPDVLPIIGRGQVDRFFRDDHRLIFAALVDLYDRGSPMDLNIVRDELTRRDILEKIGGIDYVVQLAESVPSSANAAYYARIVRDHAAMRAIIGAGHKMIESAHKPGEDARVVVETAEQTLLELSREYSTQEKSDSFLDVLTREFETMQQNDGNFARGIPTGFRKLDEKLCGLQNGEMIVIAGRPSMGKTAMAMAIAHHAAATGTPTLYYTLEMSAQSLVRRLLATQAQVSGHKIRAGWLSDADIEKLRAAKDAMRDLPLFVEDSSNVSVLDLRAKVRQMHGEQGVKIVFVDYLQLLRSYHRHQSREQDVAEISAGLKGLAKDLQIPVVVMAQLNRAVESMGDNRPRLSHLRESGAIEQDADVVLLLHRPEYYQGNNPRDEDRGVAEVIVAKQRNGPVGTVRLSWHADITRFADLYGTPADAETETESEPEKSETLAF